MGEIPDDIIKAARAVYYSDNPDPVNEIGKAILAERERCVAEMDNFIDNVTVSIDGRSRFDIYDINRQCKKSVRYVRDRLSGQFDKHWVEEPISDSPTPSTPPKTGV